MLNIIHESILKAGRSQIIIHQANALEKMKSGVAWALRQACNQMYEDYIQLCRNYQEPSQRLGQYCYTDDGEYKIITIIGQMNYGYDGQKYTDEESLKNALMDIKERMIFNNIFPQNTKFAVPWGMASDRGGAKWDDIIQILSETLGLENIIFYRHNSTVELENKELAW